MGTKDPKHNPPGALVTGGAMRLGRVIVRALAASGYAVAIHYCHSRGSAIKLAREMSARGSVTHLIQADLTEPQAAAAVVNEASISLGRIDLLVNNAAILVGDEASELDLARMTQLNLDAPIACLEAALPYLQKTAGSVVNIADIAGLFAYNKYVAYSRTKKALLDLTRKQAMELAPFGVRVNAICPGLIWPKEDFDRDHLAELIRAVPMGRIGDPQDIAEAVLFFARAKFITGQILAIDGGRSLSRMVRSSRF